MAKEDMLYENAIEAINELFSDPDASIADCRGALTGLIEEIETLLESLPEESI